MRWDWITARAEWFTFQSAGNVYSGSWWQWSTKAAVIMSLTQLHLTNEWRHRDLPRPRWNVQYHNPKIPKLFSGSVFLCHFNLFSFITSISHAHCLLLSVEICTQVCERAVTAACFYQQGCTNTSVCSSVFICVYACNSILQWKWIPVIGRSCLLKYWGCFLKLEHASVGCT